MAIIILPGDYLAEVCPFISRWILSSKSENTTKSYFNAFKRWENFLTAQGHSALPASPIQVYVYLVIVFEQTCAMHTLNMTINVMQNITVELCASL